MIAGASVAVAACTVASRSCCCNATLRQDLRQTIRVRHNRLKSGWKGTTTGNGNKRLSAGGPRTLAETGSWGLALALFAFCLCFVWLQAQKCHSSDFYYIAPHVPHPSHKHTHTHPTKFMSMLGPNLIHCWTICPQNTWADAWCQHLPDKCLRIALREQEARLDFGSSTMRLKHFSSTTSLLHPATLSRMRLCSHCVNLPWRLAESAIACYLLCLVENM